MWFLAQREQCMYYLLQLGKKAYTYLHTSFAICRWVELTQLGRPKFLSYLCMPCFALRCLRSLSSSLTQNKWCVWWWLKCYLRELLLQLCCFCYENEPRWRLVRPSTSLSLGVYVYLCTYILICIALNGLWKFFSSGVKFGHLNARPAVWAHGVIKTC